MKLNPAPLGLAAFALTTFVLSLANLGVIKVTIAIALAFFYGGMAQFAAGMWSFKAENNFAGTAFSSYGAFWLAFGFIAMMEKMGFVFDEKQIGVMLIAWGIFTFYMWIPSLKISKALSLVFLTLWLTFFALGIASIYGYSYKIGGAIGVVCALLAWYVSAVELINEFYGRKLPL
ncbi:MAG: transcriptional regulator [Thermoplasmata archaeon]|nr:MAG: transcriptional regulator [Thermoplasmata archaeon]